MRNRWSWCAFIGLALVLAACEVKDGEDKHVGLVAVVLLSIVVGLPVLYIVMRLRGERRGREDAAAGVGARRTHSAGNYVSGHPDRAKPCSAYLAINSEDFVFLGDSGDILFRIPRDAPTAIDLVDASKETQKTMQNVTVGRVALLGIYALAFPKTTTTTTTTEKYIVGISWKYNGVLDVTTCFAFTDATAANLFSGKIAKHKAA